MTKTLLAAALAAGLGLSGIASAADLGSTKDAPVFAAVDWTGLYGGINAGYGWAVSPDQLGAQATPALAGLTPTGGFAGGQLGFNWQAASHIVLGVEADIQAGSISDRSSQTFSSEDFLLSIVSEDRLNWFGTARGRIGYATGNALIYATGGFAFGGLHKEVSMTIANLLGDKTATGYAVGGGIEYKWSASWSIKGEYQYLNFGKNDFCQVGDPTNCWSSDSRLVTDDFHTVRVGLNYHLGGEMPLLATSLR